MEEVSVTLVHDESENSSTKQDFAASIEFETKEEEGLVMRLMLSGLLLWTVVLGMERKILVLKVRSVAEKERKKKKKKTRIDFVGSFNGV